MAKAIAKAEAAEVAHLSDGPEGVSTLGSLARQWLRETNGDVPAAVARMQIQLENDGDLLRSVIKAAIEDAVKLHVGGAHRNERRAILSQTTGPGRAGVYARADGMTRALLDLPLASGVKLREATRAQVVEQADRYDASATDMRRKARWLTLIAQHVPDGKTVGRAITDGRAAELWAEVDKETT